MPAPMMQYLMDSGSLPEVLMGCSCYLGDLKADLRTFMDGGNWIVNRTGKVQLRILFKPPGDGA